MHKNHASATLYKRDIDKLRSKEIESGRVIPITQELIDQLSYYHNSPLAVIDQGKDKPRAILDKSFDADTAVNAHIRKHDLGALVMDRITAMGSQMRKAYMDKVELWVIIQDVQAYFRNLPIQVRDQLLQLIRYGDGLTVIDLNENFGDTGAPFKACFLGDSICWILEDQGIIASYHYSDNFFNITNAERGQSDLKKIRDVFKQLGLPLNDKDSVLGQQFKLLGFFVDLAAFTISIPREKRLEIVQTIDKYLLLPYISVKDLRHITGVLVHYSQIVESANCYNAILWKVNGRYAKGFSKSAKILFEKHFMLQESLIWFRDTFLIWSGVSIQQQLDWEYQKALGCSSDASHIGGSFLTPSTYSFFVWCPCCIKTWNKDMTTLELGTTCIGLGTSIGRELIGKRALWVSDNAAGCYDYNKGYSRKNERTSRIIMEMRQIAIQNQVEFFLHWIPRKSIKLADSLTRGSDTEFKVLDNNQRRYIEPHSCRNLVALTPTGTKPMVFGFAENHKDVKR
jgi:hypothetical protein